MRRTFEVRRTFHHTMKNGNAIHTFIEDAIALLGQVEVVKYFAEPLPCVVDEQIRGIVSRFTAVTSPERTQFQESLAPEHRSLFGIYGHRAATIAARHNDADWLRSGLTGFAIVNYTIPEKRKVEVGMAVYWHVAQKLGVNPVDLFEETAVYAAPAIAAELLAFGRRPDVTLTKFGWQELKTAAGVKYKFNYQ
ncbi:MAG TPA: hypothetical protein PLD25_07730 [Chloroflexota bacterium]|nr:hypothetical protein [Chloroflexota bacterium]